MIKLAKRITQAASKLITIRPPKPYPFVCLPVQSFFKDFFTLVIAGMSVSIPTSYLSIVKNFGVGFLFGLPLSYNLIVYVNTASVPPEDLQGQLHIIFTEINRLLPQLNTFINQFHSFINENGINVITNAQGALGIDVPETVNDHTAQQYANRINVFDNLIHNHIHSVEDLIERGLRIEEQITESRNYTSQLMEYKNRLNILVDSYKHYKKD